MTLISLVVPCYNEEKTLPLFHGEAMRVLAEMGEELAPPLKFRR